MRERAASHREAEDSQQRSAHLQTLRQREHLQRSEESTEQR